MCYNLRAQINIVNVGLIIKIKGKCQYASTFCVILLYLKWIKKNRNEIWESINYSYGNINILKKFQAISIDISIDCSYNSPELNLTDDSM